MTNISCLQPHTPPAKLHTFAGMRLCQAGENGGPLLSSAVPKLPGCLVGQKLLFACRGRGVCHCLVIPPTLLVCVPARVCVCSDQGRLTAIPRSMDRSVPFPLRSQAGLSISRAWASRNLKSAMVSHHTLHSSSRDSLWPWKWKSWTSVLKMWGSTSHLREWFSLSSIHFSSPVDHSNSQYTTLARKSGETQANRQEHRRDGFKLTLHWLKD